MRTWIIVLLLLEGCTRAQVKMAMTPFQMLFGYVPPPQQTTVLQEITKEYDMCMAIRDNPQTCAQEAYDTVRVAKGMDKKPIPEGVVIVREEDGAVIKEMATEK